MPKCLNPVCGPEAVAEARGLCRPCYRAANRLVARGETDWADLVRRGKATPRPTIRKRPLGSVKAWLLDVEDRA